jgi:hypothetical protein
MILAVLRYECRLPEPRGRNSTLEDVCYSRDSIIIKKDSGFSPKPCDFPKRED